MLFDTTTGLLSVDPDGTGPAASVPVATVGEMFERRHFAFAVRPGDDELLRRLNMAIVSLREDGALDHVRTRWFGH
jgi:ABC-type amino acid transport substrate-binding protein